MKGNFAAIALTVIGVVALAVNLDLLQLDIVALLRKWWPLALIGVGLAASARDHRHRAALEARDAAAGRQFFGSMLRPGLSFGQQARSG